MSPYKASASDLGIGVADIVRTLGAILRSESDEPDFDAIDVPYNCSSQATINLLQFTNYMLASIKKNGN